MKNTKIRAVNCLLFVRVLFFCRKGKQNKIATKRPQIAVKVANLNNKNNNHTNNTPLKTLFKLAFTDKKIKNKIEKDNKIEYLIWDINTEASLIVPEFFLVISRSTLTK